MTTSTFIRKLERITSIIPAATPQMHQYGTHSSRLKTASMIKGTAGAECERTW